ncbi:MAG: hypothetical protein OXC61_05185 [Flavobacteriaceae bacterium]|nr:hypothetical protein [Flavobacteriaceae bacterium]
MKYYIYFMLPLGLFFPAKAQMNQIQFDGIIDSNEWLESKKFQINYEIDPGDNVPSKNLTDVFVDYDKDFLYIGFKSYANMTSLRTSVRNRDESWQDDFVMACIDTYSDGRYLICMGTNADGSQLDMKLSSSGQDDESYNINYESKTSKNDDSYHVELKIPFSVLQFKKSEQYQWNIAFYRNTYADEYNTDNLNFPIDRNNPCLPCQVPSTIHLHGIESKNRKSLIPNIVGSSFAERENEHLHYKDPEGSVGLSGLFDINNATSIEYTINPDFSQVEADVSQVTVNNTFAVRFPERRPFFNEGNDIIDTELSTVYTRFINQPLFASKLISQGEKDRIYLLTAFDQSSPYLIAGEESSILEEGGKAYVNVLRYQRSYKGGSNIGLITTSRFFEDGGTGHLVGLDATWRFGGNYVLSAEFNKNFTNEPIADWIDSDQIIKQKSLRLDGEKHHGDALSIEFSRSTRNWNTFFSYEHYSPLFNSPIGFVTQNNIKNLFVGQSHTKYFEDDRFIKQWRTFVGAEFTFNYHGLRKFADIGIETGAQLAKNISTEIDYYFEFNEIYEGQNFKNLQNFSWFARYHPNEAINLRIFIGVGDAIYYDSNPELGNRTFLGTFNNFQLSSRLSIEPSIRYTKLVRPSDSHIFYEGQIIRSVINYQFSNNLSFRFVGEVNSFDENSFIQTLLQWQPNPFTIFYIGGTNGYSYVDRFRTFQIDQVNVYFKLQYQFDI